MVRLERIYMKKKKHVISRVLPGSIGEELELEPGDILAEINHQLVEDVFDYRYLMNDEYIELLIEKANGELWELPFLQQSLYVLLYRSDAARHERNTVFQG